MTQTTQHIKIKQLNTDYIISGIRTESDIQLLFLQIQFPTQQTAHKLIHNLKVCYTKCDYFLWSNSHVVELMLPVPFERDRLNPTKTTYNSTLSHTVKPETSLICWHKPQRRCFWCFKCSQIKKYHFSLYSRGITISMDRLAE